MATPEQESFRNAGFPNDSGAIQTDGSGYGRPSHAMNIGKPDLPMDKRTDRTQERKPIDDILGLDRI